ncbi:MAG: hypothetical protein ACM3NQ_05900 [Bacteroidales bacterium]
MRGHRVVASAAAVILLLAGGRAQGQNLGPGFGQRYLILATTKAETMQDELRQAAGAGYRVVAGWFADEITPKKFTGDQHVILLEKVAAPPNTYQYLFLNTVMASSLANEAKEAAARGFRVARNVRMSDKTLLMEKAPASSNRDDYLFLTHEFVTIRYGKDIQPPALEDVKKASAAQGYTIVGMACSTSGGEEKSDGTTKPLKVKHTFVAETSLQPDAGGGSENVGDSRLLMMARPGDDLEEILREHAGKGYRLALASDADCPVAVLVMERAAQPDQRYEYLVVSGQDQLTEAAAKGFHPHPSGVLGEFGIVMERPPGPRNADRYFFIERTESTALQKELIEAGTGGLNVAAAARNAHMVVMRQAIGQPVPPEEAMAAPPRPKVFVRSMDGFGPFLMIALVKKRVPVKIANTPEEADFEISGTTKFTQPHGALRALEAFGGTTRHLDRTLDADVTVRNVRTGAVILQHHATAKFPTESVVGNEQTKGPYRKAAAEDCAEALRKALLEMKVP